jgi:hypothetical protein
MSEVKVVAIPTSNVANIWNEAYKVLKPALDRLKHRMDAVDVFTELCSGEQSLWVAVVPDTLEVKAYATAKIFDEPNARVLHIFSLAGEEMDEWSDEAMRVFDEYGKSMGCTMMTLQGRRGWKLLEKRYGFEEEAVLYKKELN